VKKIKKHKKKITTSSPFSKKEESFIDSSLEPLKETISLCMIVKNEQDNIAKCIASVKGLVDEIIVVDTGSTDMTKAKAEEFNARIYDFVWTGNFGEARNFSLSKALCDWILILDADEVISPSDHDPLKQIVKEACLKPVAFNFVSRDYVSYPNTAGWIQNDGKYIEEEGTGFVLNEGNGLRLFPNNKNIRFDCYVHGTIAPSVLRCGIKIEKCNIPIHHYGRLNQENTARKGEIYYQLQKIKLGQEKELSEEDIYYLAIQAAEIGKYGEAIEYFKRLIVTKPSASIYYNMGLSYLNLGGHEAALSALKQALLLSPHSRDIIVAYSQAEICNGNAKLAILHLEELLHKDATYQLAILALAVAYFCENRKNEGLECIRKLKELNFGCAYYFAEFAKMLISSGQINYAILLLGAAVESGNANADISLLLTQCYQEIQHCQQ
jgi:glycosyltransferase involved in cell wall biosynthesis